MRRNTVITLLAIGILIVGIIIGAVGVFVATTSKTKTVTQTETNTTVMATTTTIMVTNTTTMVTTTTLTVTQPTLRTVTIIPATITANATSIHAGQAVSIGVGWEGGQAPYTVTLYLSSIDGCSSSSTIAASKSGLSQPQFVFIVAPASTARYCGTVSSYNGTSSISSSILVTVSP